MSLCQNRSVLRGSVLHYLCGADATQTTSGIQPVYWTNQLNGSGAIIFTTEGQYPVAVPGGASLTVSRLPAGSYFVRIRAEGSPSCCRS